MKPNFKTGDLVVSSVRLGEIWEIIGNRSGNLKYFDIKLVKVGKDKSWKAGLEVPSINLNEYWSLYNGAGISNHPLTTIFK